MNKETTKDKMIDLLSDGMFRSQSKIAEELGIDEDYMRSVLFTIKGLYSKKVYGKYSYIMLYGFKKQDNPLVCVTDYEEKKQ